MASCVSRIPAVSIKRKVIPCNTTVSSMTSPGCTVYVRDDGFIFFDKAVEQCRFPGVGFSYNGSRYTVFDGIAECDESERRLMTRSISLARSVSFSRSANSTSSSLKSSSSSTSEANVSSFSRSWISSRLNPPRICCIAKRCEARRGGSDKVGHGFGL